MTPNRFIISQPCNKWQHFKTIHSHYLPWVGSNGVYFYLSPHFIAWQILDKEKEKKRKFCFLFVDFVIKTHFYHAPTNLCKTHIMIVLTFRPLPRESSLYTSMWYPFQLTLWITFHGSPRVLALSASLTSLKW